MILKIYHFQGIPNLILLFYLSGYFQQMKKNIWIWILIIFPWGAFSQGNKIDSLLRIASQLNTDTSNTKAFILLSEAYQNSNIDSAAYYANKGLMLAVQRKQKRMEAFAYNALGYINYIQGDYANSITAFQNYYMASEKISDKTAMAFAKNNEGNVYIEMGNYPKAIEKYKEALNIRIENRDSAGIAMSYNNMGYIYKDLGDYEKALSNFLFALRVYEGMNNSESVGVTYNYIGTVYWKKKDYTLSQNYLNKSLQIHLTNKDLNNLAIVYNTKGLVFAEEKKLDSAKYFFNKALQIYQAGQDTRQIAILHQSLAELYARQNIQDSAKYYYLKSIQENESIQNKRSLANLYIGISSMFLIEKNSQLAKKYLDSAFTIIQVTSKKEDWKNFYLAQSNYYQNIGEYAKSLENIKHYNEYKDSILNEDNLKAIADMQAKYDVDKKDEQIRLQDLQLSKKNQLLIGLALLALLGILLAISYYNRLRLKQKTRLQQEIMKQQDIATKMIIEAEERERKRIGGDLHDGIGQLMSAVKMNLSAIEDNITFKSNEDKNAYIKSIHLVDESCKEVRSVSHAIMPNALLRAGLSNAVKEFVEKLDNRTLKINLHSIGLNERLESSVETVLYRVIQECINNVIKHSKANALDISLIKDEDGVSVTIEDNGIGFNVAQAIEKDGIGLKNIQARINYLKGTLDIDSAIGKGTLFALHIPNG